MQPNTPYVQPPTQPGQQPNYDFIMNSGQPQKKSLLPGSDNLLGRLIIVAVLLILVFVGFSVVRSILSGPSPELYYKIITQDQTALLDTLKKSELETTLSEKNKTFAVTAKLSLMSARSETIQYMNLAGFKVKEKELTLRIKPENTAKLTQAAAASTYNEVFEEVISEQLDTYQRDLKTAYHHTKGPKGRELLSKKYDDAGLLRKQLESR